MSSCVIFNGATFIESVQIQNLHKYLELNLTTEGGYRLVFKKSS